MLVLVPAVAGRAEFRDWRLPDGRSVRAELREIRNGQLVLREENRRVPVTVPVSGLGEADRAYVRGWRPAPQEAPAPAVGRATVERDAAGWPVAVALREAPVVTVVEENRAAQRFVYRSAHFEFTCSERLSREIVREFSRIFEVTHEAVAALPLGIEPAAPRGWHRVRLFSDREAYLTAGGPQGTGGAYVGATGEVLVPLPQLGVQRSGSRWIMDHGEGHQLLVHEVTHQIMGPWLTLLPMWIVEGSAEYLTAGRWSGGRLVLQPRTRLLRSYLAEVRGIDGQEADVRSLQTLMTMDHEAWTRRMTGPEAHKNYASALLLFDYFCHRDGDGTGAGLAAYFRARLLSKTPDDDRTDREAHLLRGRDWKALTSDFEKAWRADGWKLR